MTIKDVTIRNVIAIALLASHSSVWSMEKENLCRAIVPYNRAIVPYNNFDLKKLTEEYNNRTLQSSSTDEASKDLALYYKRVLAQGLKIVCQNRDNVQQYNDNNILIALPNEVLEPIVSQINPLEDGIKSALALRTTCKHFYMLPLEHFGKAYEHHSKIEKNAILKNVLGNMSSINYWNRRCGALILIHAGADNNADKGYPLLKRAIYRNDENMITILFEHGANPNQKNLGNPDFFSIETIEIAKIFTANKVDWNTEGSKPNVLWANILHNHSSELIQFYLSQHVDTKKVNSYGDCLLHYLVSHPAYNMHDIDDYVKIGTLLIKAAPELVDTLNNKNETPIDTARNIIKYRLDGELDNDICKANEQFIALFEEQIFINKIKNSSHCTDLSRE